MLIAYEHVFPHEIQDLDLMNQLFHAFGSLSTIKICPNGDSYESPYHIFHKHENLDIFGTQNYGFLSACDFYSLFTLGVDFKLLGMHGMIDIMEGNEVKMNSHGWYDFHLRKYGLLHSNLKLYSSHLPLPHDKTLPSTLLQNIKWFHTNSNKGICLPFKAYELSRWHLVIENLISHIPLLFSFFQSQL